MVGLTKKKKKLSVFFPLSEQPSCHIPLLPTPSQLPNMAEEGASIGIDLGSSYCCVGVWQNDRVKIILNDEGNRSTPSFISFNETGTLFIGLRSSTSFDAPLTYLTVRAISW